ncbi:MAG: hypothetical protein D6765_04230 [Bacteroidetes bacterium]|nr:MAG: hypothetical protein D6765_04230 [Bacteroidota bacterium]
MFLFFERKETICVKKFIQSSQGPRKRRACGLEPQGLVVCIRFPLPTIEEAIDFSGRTTPAPHASIFEECVSGLAFRLPGFTHCLNQKIIAP